MASTLTQLVSKVQALLLDDGTVFDSTTIEAAMRQALQVYNQRAPIWKKTTVTAVEGQYEYDLSAVTDIEFIVAILDENDNYLSHVNYFIDGDTFNIRLEEPTAQDFSIIYASPHTINGLDSETTTTLQPNHETCLSDLCAGIATVMRAGGKVETVNLNANVPLEYRNQWELWKQAFEIGIVSIQRAERMPVGARVSGWNDSYHGWN